MMKETVIYAPQLSDSQWQQLEPFLIGRQGDPGASAKNNRLFIEALLWVVLNRAPWSSLPPQFGKSSTAYMRFRRWTECDFWRQLAHNAFDDPQLPQILEAIVGYADRYTQRLEQRAGRRAKKSSYRAAPRTAIVASFAAPEMLAADESTLHWVGLLG